MFPFFIKAKGLLKKERYFSIFAGVKTSSLIKKQLYEVQVKYYESRRHSTYLRILHWKPIKPWALSLDELKETLSTK